MRLEVEEEVIPAECPEVLFRPDDRKSQCVVRKDDLLEVIVYDIFRIVLRVFQLLNHYQSFFFQFLLLERRMRHDIRKDIHCLSHVRVKNPGVEAGLLLGCKRVEIPAKRFKTLCDIPDASLLGSLKHHMFNKMADPVLGH